MNVCECPSGLQYRYRGRSGLQRARGHWKAREVRGVHPWGCDPLAVQLVSWSRRLTPACRERAVTYHALVMCRGRKKAGKRDVLRAQSIVDAVR